MYSSGDEDPSGAVGVTVVCACAVDAPLSDYAAGTRRCGSVGRRIAQAVVGLGGAEAEPCAPSELGRGRALISRPARSREACDAGCRMQEQMSVRRSGGASRCRSSPPHMRSSHLPVVVIAPSLIVLPPSSACNLRSMPKRKPSLVPLQPTRRSARHKREDVEDDREAAEAEKRENGSAAELPPDVEYFPSVGTSMRSHLLTPVHAGRGRLRRTLHARYL